MGIQLDHDSVMSIESAFVGVSLLELLAHQVTLLPNICASL
jgi:hypothetical protein